MDANKIVEIINKLVQREVNKQVSLIKMQIMSEVAGMLHYSERSMLAKLDEHKSPRRNDYERVMENLDTMEGYREMVPRTSPVKRNLPKREKTYVRDSMLNKLLNETDALSSEEMYNPVDDFGSIVSPGSFNDLQYEEPWDEFDDQYAPPAIQSEAAVAVRKPFKPVETSTVPATITGTDGRPVNLRDETVQNVLNIIAKTDYRTKLQKLNEAGDNFRNMGVPPPKFSAKDFKPID